MNREPVSSTNLAEVGYDVSTQILEIKFRSGWVYQYIDVPRDIYVGLKASRSSGQYFDTFVKDKYRHPRRWQEANGNAPRQP